VYELIFKDGNLLEERDISQKMEELRQKKVEELLAPEIHNFEDCILWIADCFSRKYNFY